MLRLRPDYRLAWGIATLALVALMASGCMAGPNDLADLPSSEGDVAGFWYGLWHGGIAPFAFLVSLFNEQVQIYEVHNNGAWYNFGYVISILSVGGGGSRASRKRR